MITLRNLCGLLFALAFTLSAGASFAGEKQYVLTAANATATATPQPALTFTFTNDGNSSFNSLTLSLPSGWSISTAGGATASRGTVTINSPARNVVTVQNINLPTGAGQSMTVTVTGVTGSGTACGSGQSGGWTAQPWTGSSVGSGQKFNPKSGSTYPVPTSIPATCYVITASAGSGGSIAPSGTVTVAAGASQSFTITPNATYRILDVVVNAASVGAVASYTFNNVLANKTIAATFAQNALSIVPPSTPAVAGSQFTVSVGYNGPTPSTISLETTCSTTTVPTQSVTNPTNPVDFFVTVAKAGTCTFTAKAPPGYPDFTLPAALTVYGGTLACGTAVGSSTNNPPDINVTEDWSYPHGAVLTDGGWSLIRGENKSGSLCSGPVPYTFTLNTTGPSQTASFIVPTTETQKVAAQYVVVWAPVASSGGWFDARPGLAWKSDSSGPIYMPALPCTQDPTDFPGLSQAQLASLMPAIPNAPPYNTGTLAATYGFSTPGNIVYAKMCVSQHGWTAVGPVQSEDENGTKTLIQSWDKIIDLGDGFVSRDL